jgi:DNA-binding NarL/FixJ family response regulator
MKKRKATDLFPLGDWDTVAENLPMTRRQKEILSLLTQGHADKQIAQAMKIALPTVRTHLSRLFEKFHVQDRTELVLFVLRKLWEIRGCNDCIQVVPGRRNLRKAGPSK